MPESTGNIEEIHSSLKASLGRGHSDLDQNVVAASKRVLLESIQFQPASTPYSMQRDTCRSKYIPLNPTPVAANGWTGADMSQKQQPPASASTTTPSPMGSDRNGDCLPSPKVVLYPEDRVKMEWTHMVRIGAGLVNMGNTCFFNSTLQCLTYTAPLVNYCFTNDHRNKCKKKDFCMMCEIQNHIKSSLDCGGRSLKPHSILQKLRCIAKHMKWGRQEDAHEFLRFVVDHLQQSCLNGETKLDRFSKETTVINQIFGGYLRSQVTCLRCQGKSVTFDPFMDLSLDIKGVNTVEEALTKFVKPDILDNENAYKCPKCKNKVRAQKRFSIEKAPNVLTLQLNRFDFHHHLSGKINRFIKYPEKINLRNYMSQRNGEPIFYHLYGVLVHSGHSSEHGHYYSFVKSPSKTWYCMNDSLVHQAGSNSVFNADAYVLFYARISKSHNTPNGPSTPSHTLNPVKMQSPSKQPNSIIGPTLPTHLKQDTPFKNSINGKPSSDIGTPLKSKPEDGSGQQVSLQDSQLLANGPPVTALPGSHSKISFPLMTPFQRKQNLLQKQPLKDDGKHIVLQIKHGNSTTMEKSPDGKSHLVNGYVAKQTSKGLVPYNEDSDSEQEIASSRDDVKSTLVKACIQEAASSKTVPLASGDSLTNPSQVSNLVLPSSDGDARIGPVVAKRTSLELSLPATNIPPSKIAQPESSTSQGEDLAPCLLGRVSSLSSSVSTIPTQSVPLESHNNLEALRHKSSSPVSLKDSRNVDLPIVHTSSYADTCKLKAAGGNWFVQTQDSAPSPRSSCSSSHSVNSTTEWTVQSKDTLKGTPKVSKVQEPSSDRTDSRLATTDRKLSQPPDIRDGKVAGMDKKLSKPSNKLSSPALPASVPALASPVSSNKTSSSGRVSPTPIPTTHVDISNRLPLLNSLPSESVTRKEKKHKKKHKKELKDGVDKSREDSSSRSESSTRKKKHKKKHKHKYSSDSDSGSYEKKSVKTSSKRNYSHVSSDSSSGSDTEKCKKRRKQTSESEDSEQYEWVEKTKETASLKPSHLKNNGKASVHAWNHHVKDDVAPRLETSFQSVKSSWDGTRAPKFPVDHAGSYSFGSKVLSWDGGKNHLDKEREANAKKRVWADDYNEEIDAGKTKKVKDHDRDKFFSPDNPFQRVHSMKYEHIKVNGPSPSRIPGQSVDNHLSKNLSCHYQGMSKHSRNPWSDRQSHHGPRPYKHSQLINDSSYTD